MGEILATSTESSCLSPLTCAELTSWALLGFTATSTCKVGLSKAAVVVITAAMFCR